MSFGPLRVFSDSIASAASTSNGVNLVKAWNRIGVQIGTMSTAASMNLQNSSDGGTTFYNVFTGAVNTASSGAYPLGIASGVGTNGGFIVINDAALSYPRIVCSAVVAGGVQIKYVCLD